MATVTVFTAERTEEIEASSIVSGTINSNGHLVLTRHDGTPIDMGAVSGMKLNPGTGYVKVDAFSYTGPTDPGAVPDGSVWYDTTDVAGPMASDTQKGLVELATTAEATAGTDTQRAVTPAGLAARISADNTANPGYKTQLLTANSKAETAAPSAYPYGLSMMSVTSGSGWSLNSGFGIVLTNSIETDRTHQAFMTSDGGSGIPKQWYRTYHSTNGGGGWTAWQKLESISILAAGSFTESTTPVNYPLGQSRLIYTTANSTSWTFSGWAGEVLTYRNGTDLTKQTFTRLNGGGGAYTEIWVRTASDSSGWGAWRKQEWQDRQLITAYGQITITPSAANTVTSGAISFPAGRFPSTPQVQVTAATTVPGSQVLGVGVSGVSTTGATIYVDRNNTTATVINWFAYL